jgi:iron complex outermembrane receptor protein
MKTLLFGSAGLMAATALPVAARAETPADAQPPASLVDVIVVTAPRAITATPTSEALSPTAVAGPDPTALLAWTPGGARIGNGALSGQAQYRGLFGPRLNLRVDGQRFASGGPNLMDPPFHYAPPALLAAVEIDRGVSPVREGPGLAGGMNAVFKRVDYTEEAHGAFAYDLTAEGRSVDESVSIGGVAGASSSTWRASVLGAYEKGEDARFPGGRIGASRYERNVYGASAGLIHGPHELSLDLRHQDTGPTGNPPFPMDIRYFDTDFARIAYRAMFGDLGVKAAFSYADVGHAMNNFDLRPSPPPAQRRESLAEAVTRSAEASLTAPLAGGRLEIGGDLDDVDRNVSITNPANAGFLITSLPDIEMRRAGAFAEWTGRLGAVEAEVGARVDRHEDSAGRAVTGPAITGGPVLLAQAFNAADRKRGETTFDVVARLWTPAEDGVSWRLTLARKTRAPGYVERFGWLPTNASGGLADGNIYVGDLALEPEVAWIAEAGFDYVSPRAYLRPTVFIREVDDYIQGAPFDATPGIADTLHERVAAMNGDPTPLRFANVDARLYGFDVGAGFKLSQRWRVDGVASYVRGKRRDVSDSLYRISPPSLTAAVTHERDTWSITGEVRAVADQNKVSETNSEERTGGYAVFNLHGQWRVRDGVQLSAGVENIFDRRYSDHLSGYNQISGSDVALGARLPGAGRGVFMRLNIAR